MRKVISIHLKCSRCGAGTSAFIDSFLEPNNSLICKNCNAYYGFFKSEEILSQNQKTMNYFEKLKAEKLKGALFGDD